MRKRKISINCQDGNEHLENVENIIDSSCASPNMGQYAIIELEVDQCLKDEKTELFRKTLLKVHSRFVEEQSEPYKTKIKPYFHRLYIYAAVATIILIIGVLGIMRILSGNSSSFNPQNLFVKYYCPYQNEFITRSESNNINALYSSAIQVYENRDYKKAINLFSNIINKDKSYMAYFYRGISYIEIGNHNLAIESFSAILTNETNPYFVQANWYTALAWLKLSKPETARKYLDWLVLNDRFYGNKAKEIIKEINKKKPE